MRKVILVSLTFVGLWVLPAVAQQPSKTPAAEQQVGRQQESKPLGSDLLKPLVDAIPNFLSALLGGFIAYWTLRQQLKHEAHEKERERKLTLRRDVYLEVAEAIGSAQLFLGSFARQDIDIARLQEQIQSIPGALNKAQLVTSEATFAALDDFSDFLASRVAPLLVLRLRVDNLGREISRQQEDISRLEQRYTYVRTVLEQASHDDPLRARALDELPKIQSGIESARDRLVKLMDRNVEVTEELGREAFKATLQAQREVGRINVQIRHEIELPLDAEWYLRRLEEREKRLGSMVDEIYGKIDDILEETDRL
jgi:hypothetical protein